MMMSKVSHVILLYVLGTARWLLLNHLAENLGKGGK